MGDKMTTDVLIVGGGPVGLTTALLLDRFGIDCVLVERHESTTTYPKARGIYQRSMELMRKLGVEDAIRNRGLPPGSDSIIICESLAGREIARTVPEPIYEALTPSWKCMVSQDVVEEELHAAALGCKHARVLYSTECVALDERSEAVEVGVRDLGSGQESVWTARYVVAADGAASPIRDSLGIRMVGPDLIGVWANEFWRADLSGLRSIRDAWVFQTIPADDSHPVAQVLNTNGTDRWLTSMHVGAAQDERDRPWSEGELVEIIRRQVGIADLKVDLLGGTVWRMSSQVAASFRRGRVFLAGDAAHCLSPVGGFGLNTGFEDPHNLVWKLALVLRGQASTTLLDTYEQERRPVAESNARWSERNSRRGGGVAAMRSGNQDRIAFWIRELAKGYHIAGRSLGYVYEEGAIIPDGTIPEPVSDASYIPTDRPGSRFPHVWVDLARRRSSLDWFDTSFVVVCGPMADSWREAGTKVSTRIDAPVQVTTVPDAAPDSGLHIGLRGAALVRPDGHVAARMPWVPDDPEAWLGRALSSLLHAGAG